MAAMNQSFEDTAALFTGGMEILQDAESMGTALRTLSMRIRGKLSSLPPYTVMYMLCSNNYIEVTQIGETQRDCQHRGKASL